MTNVTDAFLGRSDKVTAPLENFRPVGIRDEKITAASCIAPGIPSK